jgi:outer membrane protein insertion porin family
VLRKNQLELDSGGYANLVSQFPGTPISTTLQIEPHTNFRVRSSTGFEVVVQLPIVNAPFRVYYAYNPLRLSQQIVAPASQFNLDGIRSQVTQDVFDSIIQPQLANLQLNPQRINFFEPKTTFRFTVSRTF